MSMLERQSPRCPVENHVLKEMGLSIVESENLLSLPVFFLQPAVIGALLFSSPSMSERLSLFSCVFPFDRLSSYSFIPNLILPIFTRHPPTHHLCNQIFST
uniref:Uncharacterized protein n=1 Tax=Opuntia streptacantha TaxID=393608 RepID=A0A7C9DYM0_OPUST